MIFRLTNARHNVDWMIRKNSSEYRWYAGSRSFYSTDCSLSISFETCLTTLVYLFRCHTASHSLTVDTIKHCYSKILMYYT